MKTVKEVAALAGVSVRTLQYYDKVGLLVPSARTAAGYRLYDEQDILRLKSILLFRELDFPLKQISLILNDENFDARGALCEQLKLLKLSKERTERLISLTEKMLEKEENIMDFTAFDKSEIEKYKAEAKELYGGGRQYAEYEKKAAARTEGQNQALSAELMAFFTKFSRILSLSPQDKKAQEIAGELFSFINENFYTCDKSLFSSLGQMYACDERFKNNIDSFALPGTAEFASAAIAYFCKKD